MKTPQITLEEQVECYRLLLVGKKDEVEIWNSDQWEPICFSHRFFALSHPGFESPTILRLKRNAYKPWNSVADVPLNCWLRSKENPQLLRSIVYLCPHGVILGEMRLTYSWQELFDLFECSIDGKTWEPCGKKVG